MQQRFPDQTAQLQPQPFFGHGKDIHGRLPGGWLQIAAGSAMNVDDVARFIDEDRGRSKPVEQQMLAEVRHRLARRQGRL
jgi:hypothetical protein